MTLVQLKWRCSVNFMESSGKTVVRIYEAPAANFADSAAFEGFLQTAVTGFLAQLNALTDAVISSYTIEQVFVEDALTLPTGGVENQNEAFLSFKIEDDPTDSGNLSIPAATDSIFISATGSGRDIVDTADAALVLWVGRFDGGELTVSDGEYVDLQTLRGVRRNVRSGKT